MEKRGEEDKEKWKENLKNPKHAKNKAFITLPPSVKHREYFGS